MGSRERAVMGLESRAVSALVTKNVLLFLVKHVIMILKLSKIVDMLNWVFFLHYFYQYISHITLVITLFLRCRVLLLNNWLILKSIDFHNPT